MSAAEERIARNAPKCGPNVALVFKGAVPVAAKYQNGNDYTRLDIVFSEGISVKIFDPRNSQRDKSVMMHRLGYLAECVGTDIHDIPPCKGGWEEFVQEVVDLLFPYKGVEIYVKLTVNESGWIEPGEGRCFSKRPDMEYTDSDIRFLPDVEQIAPGTHIGFENLPGEPAGMPALPSRKKASSTPPAPEPKKREPLTELPSLPTPEQKRKEALMGKIHPPDEPPVWTTPSKAPEEPREKDWLDKLDEEREATLAGKGAANVEPAEEAPVVAPEQAKERRPRQSRKKKDGYTPPPPIPKREDLTLDPTHVTFDDLPF